MRNIERHQSEIRFQGEGALFSPNEVDVILDRVHVHARSGRGEERTETFRMKKCELSNRSNQY